VVARFFHAGSLLREHRGDGHIAALMIEGVGGLEAHVLFALDMGMPAEKFGRIHHLPAAQLAAVIDGMRDRGLIGDDGWLSDAGCAVKQRVEALTDDLAAKPYERLEPGELDELMAALEPLATLLLDALKGWLPVFVIHHWGAAWGLGAGTAALAGLAAFLGHLYPVFFRFQGGKGVATAAGVLITALLVTVVGVVASFDVLFRKPLATLRSQ